MNLFCVSLILNAVAVVVIKMQYNHIKRLQVVVQPMDPIEFGQDPFWYDCDYDTIIQELAE